MCKKSISKSAENENMEFGNAVCTLLEKPARVWNWWFDS